MRNDCKSAPKALLRILSLTLALMMALSLCLTASAADDTRAKKDPPPYTVDRYGNVTIYVSDTEIITDWDDDGCEIEPYFLSSDSLLRRLRLTFDKPYNLYDAYQRTVKANTADAVLDKAYGKYGCLRDYLSAATIRYCSGSDGVDFLYRLVGSREYRNNVYVQYLYTWNMNDLESTYAPSLRRSLVYFYSERYLNELSLQGLQSLASRVISTPEYIVFFNTLYYHDCSTVKSLQQRGYSTDYIARLYSNQAKNAVAAIWVNYQELMDDYWNANHSW